MNKEKEKSLRLSSVIIIILLCTLLLSLAFYISYDKYFGPKFNWFNYHKRNHLKNDCNEKIEKELNNLSKNETDEFKLVEKTYGKTQELINGETLLSPYVDVNVEGLKLSCQKIQKDFLVMYLSDSIVNNILSNNTINNEFVNCIIKETGENYGPRNIFANTIFGLDNDKKLISLAYKDNYYLTAIDNHYIIFEKTNDIWKISEF